MNFLYRMIFHVNIIGTLWINFRCLPLALAIKLPILVGNRVALKGLRRGSIQLLGNIRPFCVRLGLENDFSIYPNKREFSMYRCSPKSVLTIDVGRKGCKILNGFSITNHGRIDIGKNFVMNQHCTIYCRNEIQFGDFCRIGWNCQFMDTDLHLTYNLNTNKITNPIGTIHIAENVWIASGCIVMKNTTIPKFSIVAGGSLINKNFSDIDSIGNVFAGSPAKLKTTGIVRLLDWDFEVKTMKHFKNTGDDFIEKEQNFDFMTYCKD